MKHCSLREARDASGLSATFIAKRLELSRSQLYRIESGECQAKFPVARRIRLYWPEEKVPDLAVYDPEAFEQRRVNGGA